MPRLLAAPDKFRGTASAAEAATAMTAAGRRAGWQVAACPLSDGGEGLLECLGGANRTTVVTGPLGTPVAADWRLVGALAVIEMAAASGIALVTGRNDPIAATTRGTGELIRVAIEAGAGTVIVGAGGSATTDGGRGVIDVLRGYRPLDGTRGVQVIVACDVRTRFGAAARTFAAQKGADISQIDELTARLDRLAAEYLAEFGRDVRELPGAGAAGGLAGGLAALGAAIRPGFGLVADLLDLPTAISAADLVVTGEGRLDPSSLQGKVPGSLVELCRSHGVPAAVVAGEIAPGFAPPFRVVELARLCGAEAARADTVGCIERATAELLAENAP